MRSVRICSAVWLLMWSISGSDLGQGSQVLGSPVLGSPVLAGFEKQESQPEVVSARDPENVISFARLHHPELAVLLEQLRSASSPEFGRAIRELSGQMNRLERIQERTPQRFEFELTSWKLESQIRLLLARWAMSQDPVLEQQIRGLLTQRQLHRTQQLRQERQKLADRLDVINEQLAELSEDSELRIEEEWQRMSRRAGSQRKPATAVRNSGKVNKSSSKK